MVLPEFLTHSSTIFTTARRIFGSGDFSMREVRMTWMKFFLISMFMTDSLSFTRSKLSMTNSLVTTVNIEEQDYMTAILFSLCKRFTCLLWFYKTNKEEKLYTGSHIAKCYINLKGYHQTYITNCKRQLRIWTIKYKVLSAENGGNVIEF